MKKNERDNLTSSYDFNDNGTNEVSEQIMNSYNSGVIDQDVAKAASEANERTEG